MTSKEYDAINSYMELRESTFYPFIKNDATNPLHIEPIEVSRMKLLRSMSIINSFKNDRVCELVDESINNLHCLVDQMLHPTEEIISDPVVLADDGKWFICKEIKRCIIPLFTYKKIHDVHMGLYYMPKRGDYAQILKGWINEYQGKEYNKYFEFLQDISNLLQRIDHDHPQIHP